MSATVTANASPQTQARTIEKTRDGIVGRRAERGEQLRHLLRAEDDHRLGRHPRGLRPATTDGLRSVTSKSLGTFDRKLAKLPDTQRLS